MITSASATTINTLSSTAPSAGYITVLGQAFVNDLGNVGLYELEPQLDGADVSASRWAALHYSPGGEEFMLNFAISTPVTAGAHTVTDIFDGVSGSFYNQNNQNVLFAPSGGVTLATAARSTGKPPLGR